jgi:purine-binding chemotaxis protein CheW
LQIHDHVIVLEQGNRRLGMIVNEVQGVHEISPDAFDTQAAVHELPRGSARFVRHFATLDTVAFMVLDHERLLSPTVEARVDVPTAALAGPDVQWQQSGEGVAARDGLPTQTWETIPPFFQHVAPWERDLLLERARQLASSFAEQSATQQIPLAIVGLSGEYFAVELETVREFTDLQRITPVPCCPDHIVGDMNLRGDILTVVDIRQALQMPIVDPAPTAKIMVVPLGEAPVGVLVDQVFAVFDLDPCALTAVPSALGSVNDTYLTGTVSYAGKMLAILDLPKILTSGGLTVNDGA